MGDQQHRTGHRSRLPWIVLGVAVLMGAVVVAAVLISAGQDSGSTEPTTTAARADPVDEVREACKATVRFRAERQGYQKVNFTKMDPTATADGGEMTGEAELVLNDDEDERYREAHKATFTCTASRNSDGDMIASANWELVSES